MLSECGKPDAAMRFYRRALELDPSLIVAHVNLGKLSVRRWPIRGGARFVRGGDGARA